MKIKNLNKIIRLRRTQKHDEALCNLLANLGSKTLKRETRTHTHLHTQQIKTNIMKKITRPPSVSREVRVVSWGKKHSCGVGCWVSILKAFGLGSSVCVCVCVCMCVCVCLRLSRSTTQNKRMRKEKKKEEEIRSKELKRKLLTGKSIKCMEKKSNK